jgi:alkylmercury lyase
MSEAPRLESTLTCPSCGYASRERMPADACVILWNCPGCGARIKPKTGDCCVFCSYGSVPCPPIQAACNGCDQEPNDARGLAQHVLAAYPGLDDFEQRLSLALYRELARGVPVTPKVLAERVAASSDDVARRLENWPAVRRDELQRIVGYWGLTIVPTPHRMRVGERDLYGWCAWDTLFLPALLGVRAEVHSTCRATGAPVQLSVGPDALEAPVPTDLVLSFVLPEASAMRRDVVASFCSHVHFFRSAELAAGCPGLPSSTFFLTLGEAFEAGRLRNSGRYWAVSGLPGASAGAA